MDTADPADQPEDPLPWRKVLLGIALWTIVIGGLALYYAWKWLAFDEPNVALICEDGTAQCSSGEANNRATAIAFTAVWFAPFLICGLIVLWARRLKAQQQAARSAPLA